MLNDTIFALASAHGRAGIAVIRISGPDAVFTAASLCNREGFVPRHAHFASVRDPREGTLLDRGIVIFFPAPHSYTGEDVIELHLHGGAALLRRVMAVLGDHFNLRLAEAGEFTRRAFEHGRLDLVEAEGVRDLIEAETEAQHQLALRQLEGSISRQYEQWRHELITILAWLEAEIDFTDEELPDDLSHRAEEKIRDLIGRIKRQLDDGQRADLIRQGYRIALIGRPNVGKSSLMNCLARRDVAIVSDIAGTTRDVLEARLDLKGYLVDLIDTAGQHETDDPLEKIGVERARAAAESASLNLLIVDATQPPDRDLLQFYRDERLFVLINKIDRAEADLSSHRSMLRSLDLPFLPLSVKTGEGIDALLAMMEERVVGALSGASSVVIRHRHRQAIAQALAALEQSLQADEITMRAEDIRMAMRYIGSITGLVDVEEILDVVFRDFCIGK